MSLQSFLSVPAVLAALMLCIPAPDADAAGPQVPGVPESARMAPMVVPALKLIRSYISNGISAPLSASTFTVLDTRTVNCPNTAGCYIGQESMVSLDPAGGNWAICLKVNAAYTTCQMQGQLAHLGSFVVGNARGVASVPQGSHTVQTTVYAEAAGLVAQWQTDYRLYKP